jgi:hypothetical protein
MGWWLGFPHIHDIGSKNPQTLGRGRAVKKKTKAISTNLGGNTIRKKCDAFV